MTLEQDIWKASKGLGLNATIETTEALRLIRKFKLDLADRLDNDYGSQMDAYDIIEELRK